MHSWKRCLESIAMHLKNYKEFDPFEKVPEHLEYYIPQGIEEPALKFSIAENIKQYYLIREIRAMIGE